MTQENEDLQRARDVAQSSARVAEVIDPLHGRRALRRRSVGAADQRVCQNSTRAACAKCHVVSLAVMRVSSSDARQQQHHRTRASKSAVSCLMRHCAGERLKRTGPAQHLASETEKELASTRSAMTTALHSTRYALEHVNLND